MSEDRKPDPLAQAAEIVEAKTVEFRREIHADAARMLTGREACDDCVAAAPETHGRRAVVYHPACGHYVCRDHLQHDCKAR